MATCQLAAGQAAFEKIVIAEIDAAMSAEQLRRLDGIIIVGGCALNVRMNSIIREHYGKPVYRSALYQHR